MSLEPGSILAAGNALLSAVVTQLTAQGAVVPAAQCLVPGGLVAFDTEQLTVNLLRIPQGYPAQAQSTFHLPALTTFNYEFAVYLLRKVKTLTAGGKPPAPAALTTDFGMLATDMEQMVNAMIAIAAQELVVPTQIPFTWGPPTTIGPEGGLAGLLMPVSFQSGMSMKGY